MPNECIKASLFSQKADHVHAVNTEKENVFPLFVRSQPPLYSNCYHHSIEILVIVVLASIARKHRTLLHDAN